MIHVYYKLRKIIVADVVPTSTGKEGNDKQARSMNGNGNGRGLRIPVSPGQIPAGGEGGGAKPPEAARFCQNFKSISCIRRKHPFSLANT